MHYHDDQFARRDLFFLRAPAHIASNVLPKEAFMIRRALQFIPYNLAALAAVGIALAVVAPAQAETQTQAKHARAHHRYSAMHYARNQEAANDAGQIVVHTGRNFPTMTPDYPNDPLATRDAYFVDTALATDPGQEYPFGIFGQSGLPSRFNPPGQDEPLFRFW
jgi:hypothetical protein